MNKQQGIKAKFKSRQQGAVAIIVSICLVVLIGMLGLVLDLGHLYVAKSELQNVADAAALSGAKELDGTSEGVISAYEKAREVALLNNYDFNNIKGFDLAKSNVEFCSSPNGGCVNYDTAEASPIGKLFLKVDTGPQYFNTWFVHVLPGAPSVTRTFGMAVAGRYVVNITPIGVCAIDPENPTRNNAGELLEYGFRRGMAYDILTINNQKRGLASLNQVPLWIDPIAAPPSDCVQSNSSDDNLRPFTCAGESSSIVVGETIYINEGAQSGQDKFLNSRFDNSQSFGNNKCDATSSPPDSNVKQYPFDSAVAAGGPRDWTQPGVANDQPARQTVALNPATPGVPFGYPNVPPNIGDLGALWSFTRAVRYDGSVSGNVGTAFGVNDWGPDGVVSGGANLYKLDADTTSDGYPTTAGSGFPAGTQAAPYNQSLGNKYHESPPRNPPGLSGRRVLNVAVINCDVPAASYDGCKTLQVKAIAKFFMTVPSSLPNRFEMEFAGVVNTGQVPRDVRLYR